MPKGIVLSINNGVEVKFGTAGKIVVEYGGKLVLNGCTLTTADICLWDGIEAWGVSDDPQVINLGSHGIVIIENGALIENARDAVQLWKPGDFSSTGGIVQATSSTFRNNRRDVEFISYHNFNATSLVPMDNVSYFENCTFITDAALLNNSPLIPHVSMWDVHGVKFRGNIFKNTFNQSTMQSSGTGIYSIDASYRLTRTCEIVEGGTNECLGTRNKFEGLSYGIKTENSNATIPVSIKGCEFLNTYRDVYLSNSGYATITRNIFNVFTDGSTFPYGLYLNGCNGYTVERNEFHSLIGSNTAVRGIVLNNSASSGNEIYKNDFHDIGVGIQAQGSSQLGSNEQLQIKCNTFSGNMTFYDIAVTSGEIGDPQGACDPLGVDVSLPAGNSFSHKCNFIYSDLASVSGFAYKHHNDAQRIPQCYSTPVNPDNCLVSFTTASCPFHTTITDGSGKKSEINNITQEISSRQSLLTAGNSTALFNAITTLPDGQVKNILIDASPYLSDSVLIEYSNTPTEGKKAVSPGNYKQVIIANSPVTPAVKTAIDQRSLPPGIRQQIEAAQVGVSARATLEGEIRYYESRKIISEAELKRFYLSDTAIINGIDSVIAFLEQSTEPEAKAELAEAYAIKGDTSQALATIDELTGVSGYENYVAIHSLLLNTGDNVFSLINDTSVIRQIADDTLKRGYLTARAILALLTGQTFSETIEDFSPPSAKIARQDDEGIYFQEHSPEEFVHIYPNPATSQITVEHKLKAKATGAAVVFYNVMGEEIIRFKITGETGASTIDISNINSGIIFYSIVVNNNTIARDKVVIIK